MDGENGENVVDVIQADNLWESGRMISTQKVIISAEELHKELRYGPGLYENWPVQIKVDLRVTRDPNRSSYLARSSTGREHLGITDEGIGLGGSEIRNSLNTLEEGVGILAYDIRRLDINFPIPVAPLVKVCMRLSSQKNRTIPNELILIPADISTTSSIESLGQLVPSLE